MSNPYKKLGIYEPFNIFGIHAMVFEAFKKITCAGIDGRTKSFGQDLKEAVYTLNRAIEQADDAEEDVNKNRFADIDIKETIETYELVVGNGKRLKAASEVLMFCKSGDSNHLKNAVETLEEIVT